MPTRKVRYGFGATIPAGARRAAALMSLTSLHSLFGADAMDNKTIYQQQGNEP